MAAHAAIYRARMNVATAHGIWPAGEHRPLTAAQVNEYQPQIAAGFLDRVGKPAPLPEPQVDADARQAQADALTPPVPMIQPAHDSILHRHGLPDGAQIMPAALDAGTLDQPGGYDADEVPAGAVRHAIEGEPDVADWGGPLSDLLDVPTAEYDVVHGDDDGPPPDFTADDLTIDEN